jgi:hypothetical protein
MNCVVLVLVDIRHQEKYRVRRIVCRIDCCICNVATETLTMLCSVMLLT